MPVVHAATTFLTRAVQASYSCKMVPSGSGMVHGRCVGRLESQGDWGAEIRAGVQA